MRNILDLSAIMALGNLKPNISWHSVTTSPSCTASEVLSVYSVRDFV